MQFELSKEYLEKLQDAIEHQNNDYILQSMEVANPTDISALLDELDTEQSKYIIDCLDNELSAEIINGLDSEMRVKFLKIFTPQEIAKYINELHTDDAADILNELPVKQREEVIAVLGDVEKTRGILDLLRYEEDYAGALMGKELIKANLNWTIVQCIEEIRRQAEKVQRIYTVYVVDDQDKLIGRVSLKRIILAEDNIKIADIFDEDVFSVETYMPKEEVAALMQKYDLDAMPVVNVQGKLVGRITIDDILDVITEQAEQERQLMAGISEDVEEDDNVWRLSRARLPWLLIGMTGGLVGAKFIGFFEEDLRLIPTMAFFIPLITATGGNVGIQSSSIIVQSLANKTAFVDSVWKRLLKVFIVAIINGIVLALTVFSFSLFILGEINLPIVVSIALFSVILLASFMGTITPLILDKLGINPALASGPFITTTNDLLGLAVYFFVAHFLLNLA